MADGPPRALALIDAIERPRRLLPLPLGAADLLRRLGRDDEAAAAYERALELAPSEIERNFLQSRLAESRG